MSVASPTAVVPRQAHLFVQALVLVSFVAVIGAQLTGVGTDDLRLMAMCVVICAAGSLFEVDAPPGGYALQPHLAVVVFAALVLSPVMGATVAVAASLPGALRRHETTVRIAFNTATLVLCSATAAVVSGSFGASDSVPGFFCGMTAFVLLNHALLGAVSTLAAGAAPADAFLAAATLKRTRGLELALELALALTGASIAALWIAQPGALALALGPAVLACAALWVPTLRHASQTDAKTGLFNYGHVRSLMATSMTVAARTGGPVSVLMVDLDHLRAVNNRYGHLTGDALIAAVARLLIESVGKHGSAGRFGGEEFCAVLPQMTTTDAAKLAERLRARVAEDHLGTGAPAMGISIGVAGFPEHGADVDAVLHAADMALYDAKLGGRNRVRIAPLRAADVQPVPPAPAPEPPAVSPPAPQAASAEPGPRAGWVGPYSTVLVLGAVVLGLLSSTDRIAAEPGLFVALVASVFVLDMVRIQVFERLNTSPAGMPTIVLAALFGPLGPITSELTIVLNRLVRGHPPVRIAFDFGALSLAGGAAAVTYTVLTDAGMAIVPAGALAGAAYYAVNLPLLATVIWLNNGTSPLQTFREQLAWLIPHYAAYGALAGLFIVVWNETTWGVFLVFGLPTLMLWVSERQYVARTRDSVSDLRRSHAELERANDDLRRLLHDNQQLLARRHADYLSTITALARTIEAKDPYTGGHTDRVARVALALATEMGFGPDELDAVQTGAAIHDIGKIGVSDETLLKPGPLTIAERAEIERHPEISSYIVAELDVPAIVKQMVRSHHERYDGNGYPDGLVAEEIPLAARILTVADALDAMTSDRPYRSAMTTVEALAAIDEHRGTQFCPDVVDALHRHLGTGPTLAPQEAFS